jgi:hypothetical protein
MKWKLLKLCGEMLVAFEKLGDDPMARIDARWCHRRFVRKFNKLTRATERKNEPRKIQS